MVAVSGCGPKKNPTRTSTASAREKAGEPNPQSGVNSDVDTRMTELRQKSQELTAATQQLPGRASADDRKLVADAFAKAASSLELLGGPQPGGAFRQQLRIVENTKAFLNSSNANAPADPSVDTGLRSIESALTSVRERLFPNDEKVKSQIDALRTRLSELDSVRGPIHSLVVAQAFQSASSVIDTMSQELDARNDAVRQAQQPAPQPQAGAAPRPPQQPSAQAAPVAVPAAAMASPAGTPPRQAAATAAPAAQPTAASIPQPGPQKRSYEELQRDYEKLQQQYRDLEQRYQQQQPPQPGAAPAPAPAPSPAPSR
jgi:DNA repair exonuclease SbcCD ATPase subunit